MKIVGFISHTGMAQQASQKRRVCGQELPLLSITSAENESDKFPPETLHPVQINFDKLQKVFSFIGNLLDQRLWKLIYARQSQWFFFNSVIALQGYDMPHILS